TRVDFDEDVASMSISLEQYYQGRTSGTASERPAELEQMLRAIFAETEPSPVRLAASDLIRRIQHDLPGSVFQWTGHLPARPRWLLESRAERPEGRELPNGVEHEPRLTIAVTSLVTALAMNWLQSGKYVP